jgi:LAS superfamily LD-carboxypeptidase LdcB
MQVRHPSQFKSHHKRRNPSRSLLIIPLLIVVLSGLYWHTSRSVDKTKDTTASVPSAKTTTPSPVGEKKQGTLKTFTGAQFRDLYNSIAYPNTAAISEDAPITGNAAADAQIKTIAKSRGYLARSAPVTDTFRDVGEGFKLQERAAKPFLNMRAAAKKDGIDLGLTAAYRSADDQKDIFLTRLKAANVPIEGIASGRYDVQVSQVLAMTAIPGYSRHHTGYTVDIACGNSPDSTFLTTACFTWLSTDNYKNAKTYGWIPSYPDGAGNQGPDPEPWEYVWVGVDAVTE